ncbi:MAG: chemotaxis protein CheA [Thermoguttaceae bacterium]
MPTLNSETTVNDLNLTLEFVQEAREYIDEVEPMLIEIFEGSRDGAADPELINTVFRLFHSMKGSAGFLSLNTVVGVTHEAETLLDKIRQGIRQLNSQITHTLCRCLDLFREMLDHIAETGNDEGFTDQATVLIAKLKQHVLGNDNDDEPAAPAPTVAAPVVVTPVVVAEPPKSVAAAPVTATVSATADDAAPASPLSDAQQLTEDMRLGFVQEATEQLNITEQALLQAMEQTSGDVSEFLKEAFRSIHSLKGNCGFMGFAEIEQLTHSMETLLDGLRNGEIKPDQGNLGKLLSLLDVLTKAVEGVAAGGTGSVADLLDHIIDLNLRIKKGKAAGVAATTQAAPAPASPPVTAAAAPAPVAPAATVASAPVAPAPAPAAAPAAKAASSTPPPGKQDIRVDLGKLDTLINLVGELVIAESMVTRCPAVAHVEDEYYSRAKHQLRRICDDLKDVAMAVRMIPLSATFRKMVRLVHDLAVKSGKKIKLNLVGEETEVDKTVIEQIADPLVHIVRNSCDHGIEATPEDRIRAGKPDTGVVTLEGRHEGGEVWILITDDGRGLNRERILAKALEKGLVGPEAAEWEDEKVFKLVFEPGFSTAEKVTDISGRGVGMDVVRRNIEKLNGRIDIRSRLGAGATFILRIPLTLAIVDAMLVRVGKSRYMLPTLSIRESLVPEYNQITITPDGKELLRLREEIVPIVRLHDIYNCKPDSMRLKDGILMVVEDAGRSFSLFVDEIIGQQQTVIKGLPEAIGKAHGFSGCTILGDGTVSLIIDIGVVSKITGNFVVNPAGKHAYWYGEEASNVVADTTTWADKTSPESVSFADLEAQVPGSATVAV